MSSDNNTDIFSDFSYHNSSNDLLFNVTAHYNPFLNITTNSSTTNNSSNLSSNNTVNDVAEGSNNAPNTSNEYSIQFLFGLIFFFAIGVSVIKRNLQRRIQQFHQQQEQQDGNIDGQQQQQQQSTGNRPMVEAIPSNTHSRQKVPLSAQEFQEQLLHTVYRGNGLTKWKSERKISIQAIPSNGQRSSSGGRKRSSSSLSRTNILSFSSRNVSTTTTNNDDSNVVVVSIDNEQSSITMSNNNNDLPGTSTIQMTELHNNNNERSNESITTVDPESLQRTTNTILATTASLELNIYDTATGDQASDNNGIVYEGTSNFTSTNRTIINGQGTFRTMNRSDSVTMDTSNDTNNKIIIKTNKPKYHLSDSMNIDVCSICLDELQDEDFITALPNCCHVYHTKCIREWLLDMQSTYCPLCKSNVK